MPANIFYRPQLLIFLNVAYFLSPSLTTTRDPLIGCQSGSKKPIPVYETIAHPEGCTLILHIRVKRMFAFLFFLFFQDSLSTTIVDK
jgi:hypothetical protein